MPELWRFWRSSADIPEDDALKNMTHRELQQLLVKLSCLEFILKPAVITNKWFQGYGDCSKSYARLQQLIGHYDVQLTAAQLPQYVVEHAMPEELDQIVSNIQSNIDAFKEKYKGLCFSVLAWS